MSRRYRRPCPTATKTPYGDRIAAELALAKIRNEPRPASLVVPIRSYQCPCGKWHLTSQRKLTG